MDQLDVLVDYKLTKNKKKGGDNLQKMIKLIYAYVQNNKIYFKYEPQFINSIMVFGIIGYREEQKKMFDFLEGKIEELGGKLEAILERDPK